MPFIPRIIEVNPISDLVDRIGDLQAEIEIRKVEIKAREIEIEELKKKLIRHLDAAGLREFQGKRFAVYWKGRKGFKPE